MWLDNLFDRMTEAIDRFKGRKNAILKQVVFNLNAAGEQEINLAGNFIYVVLGADASDTTANINIQFNSKDADQDQYNFVPNFGMVHPFSKIYVSWAAQAGKTLTLWIGQLAPELLNVIDNRSGVVSTTLLTNILAELQGIVAAGADSTVQVLAAAGGIVLAAANANRKSIIIQNMPGNTGNIYLGYSTVLTATDCFVELEPGQAWTCDDYRGAVWGLAVVNLERATVGEV